MNNFDNLRDRVGEAIAAEIHSGAENPDWFDAREIDRLANAALRAFGPPIDLVLFCPACGTQHIDAEDEATGWTNPQHCSHLCASCGHVWRPADVCTNGVADINTHGKADTTPPVRNVVLRYVGGPVAARQSGRNLADDSVEWMDLLGAHAENPGMETVIALTKFADEFYRSAAPASGGDASVLFNGFDVNKLPSILISCVAKLWPGSHGIFWETVLEMMPARIEQLTKSGSVTAPAAEGTANDLTERQKAIILHDYPVWQQFWHKHALGPMLAPSCLVCGQMTSTFFAEPHPSDVVIKHGELPGVVVCRSCRDKATIPATEPVKVEAAQAGSGGVTEDAERLDGWKEAAIAWEICASIHRQYAKGKDALFTTRQSDYARHADAARAALKISN